MNLSRFRTAATLCRLIPWFIALGVLKRVVSPHALARWCWRPALPSSRRGDVDRIASCVFRAGTLAGLPDRDCLQRSLLLYKELSRAGFAPELALGFRRVDGHLDGHAWVSVEGRVVGEPQLDPCWFAGILTFGERGRLQRTGV